MIAVVPIYTTFIETRITMTAVVPILICQEHFLIPKLLVFLHLKFYTTQYAEKQIGLNWIWISYRRDSNPLLFQLYSRSIQTKRNTRFQTDNKLDIKGIEAHNGGQGFLI